MRLRRIAKALLRPPFPVLLLLLPVAVALLVYAMVKLGTEALPAVLSYVLAAYTLAVWCVKIPELLRWARRFKAENKYARRWREDVRLRMNVSLYGSVLGNTLFGSFQLWLGLYHRTLWFTSLGAYYILLALMRFFLLRYTRRYALGERMREELARYRICGWAILLMSLALSLIIFFMIYWGRSFEQGEIVTITMAAYTFTALATAIVSVVKCRKRESPILSASKAISLVAASVSVLTLESTMLTAFGGETVDTSIQRLMLGLTGVAVAAFIIGMAIYMIREGTKRLKRMKR